MTTAGDFGPIVPATEHDLVIVALSIIVGAIVGFVVGEYHGRNA